MPQFQCGGVATRLPAIKLGFSKLVIRINDAADTAKVLFRLEKKDLVASGKADGYLNAGESIEFRGEAIEFASDISILDISDNPIIYWGIM
jgi:hypothetical protein